jgi:arylsulfatase A-like enzyme
VIRIPQLILAFTAASTFSFGALHSVAAAETPSKPNFVILIADDLGYTDVGWHGSEIKTPNLDRLANEGAKLEQFYVQPVCSPTRAALMTGRYPMRHGLQTGVVRPWAQYGLPLEERTLPQALREVGYETSIVGKWHLGHFQRDYLPTRRGFEHQYGHYNGALDYFTHEREGGFDWHRDDEVCRDEGYSTILLGDEAVRRIQDRDKSRPFFLYVPFNAPHAPLQAPQEYLDRYSSIAKPQRQKYCAMVSCVDDQVGRIVKALDDAGLRENTLLFFSSDNGGPIRQGATNGALREGKGTLYEGGVRVSALANWKGRIPPRTVVNAPLHIVDLYPTLLTLAGASLEQPLPIDGKDVREVVASGAASPHQEILLNVTPSGGAIRHGDWKLVVNGTGATNADDGDATAERPNRGRRRRARSEEIELFNLADDPSESKNLAQEKPGLVQELEARLDAYADEAVPPKSRPKAADFRAPAVWGEAE